MEKKKDVFEVYQTDAGSMEWKSVVIFALMIILTSISLWGLFYSNYTPKPLFAGISVLAFVQAMLQLFKVQTRP
ncbi:hypothetical protein [Thalassobacillus sp. CUG 92003]|uniref:hypothetical protein n=1 Tax=Thalassobacillus sp. CUG 92003 TaxID=2736641 RepID=UPI0015E63C2B|nr:hypothetical protein [Thalassobacillus sp. CUG 92003]